MKRRKPNTAVSNTPANSSDSTVLDAEDMFTQLRSQASADGLSELDLVHLGELTVELLNDKNLEISKVKPFFWRLVEVYVDRFQTLPFDARKALFSYLEMNDYPEDVMQQLVKQLELQFEKSHGRPLRKSTQLLAPQDALADEIRELRDSLKYAALVAEEIDES